MLIKLNKDLNKNQIISAQDVYFDKTNNKGANTYFTEIDSVLGKKTKISLKKEIF